MDIRKVKTLMKIGWIHGPSYILFYLKILEREKELFAIQLERGKEVRIPPSLAQSRLPLSMRFYDPIINIIKSNFTG